MIRRSMGQSASSKKSKFGDFGIEYKAWTGNPKCTCFFWLKVPLINPMGDIAFFARCSDLFEPYCTILPGSL